MWRPLHDPPKARCGAALLALSVGLSCTPGAERRKEPPGKAREAEPLRPLHPVELKLERALPIETMEAFEPSGLLLHDGKLLTVSDRHDDSVWEIVIESGTASLRRYLKFDPGDEESRPLDFEGLSQEPGGALLLASEARYRVLRVSPDGSADWYTPQLAILGRQAGLFLKRNAGLEGVARLPNGRLLLAAEREPRGLIELPPGGNTDGMAWAVPGSAFEVPAGRSLDFADLTVFDGSVYALVRNLNLVVRLERTGSEWREREGWSYAKTENDPRYTYEDRRYGLGEGLAIDQERVYLVLDNNERRRTAVEDTRPLLFIFRRPR
jgi:hypothetical protein